MAVKTYDAAPWRPSIVALGRLSNEKGFDLLLEAFGRISPGHPEWELRIYGEGPERDNLTKLISSLGLSTSAHLPGWSSSTDEVLASSELFVLPSRYEGFPNSLCEAMACGLACVAFNCRSGPSDIIEHGVNGFLVESGSVSGLADAMEELMASRETRSRLGISAQKITDSLGTDHIATRWLDLAVDVAKYAEKRSKSQKTSDVHGSS